MQKHEYDPLLRHVERALLLQAAVNLNVEFARRTASQASDLRAEADVYSRAGDHRAAAALTTSIAVAGVTAGVQAQADDWVILVPAEEPPTPPPVVVTTPGEEPAAPRRLGRPRKTDGA